MNPALLLSSSSLVHLAPVDMVIIAFYFVLVIAIGFYLKGQSNTGEDFFMAGREMTAWVAGLSFLSANLGAPDRRINTAFSPRIGTGSAPFPR
jgi:SSS family solute:Na+ symporter